MSNIAEIINGSVQGRPGLKRAVAEAIVAEGGAEDDDQALNSVKNADWKWPSYDAFEDEHGRPQLRKRKVEVKEDVGPFQVIFRRKKNLVWPDVIQVSLSSPVLIKAVQEFLPQHSDLHCLQEPKVDGRDLFAVFDLLRSHNPSPTVTILPKAEAAEDAVAENGDSADAVAENGDSKHAELYMGHLVRMLQKEYSDAFGRFQHMKEDQRVAWDMLWTFLTPGKKVVYNCDHSQERLAAVVSRTSHMLTQQGWMLSIDLDVCDYDGSSYHKCHINRAIVKFDGERPFSSLAVRPIELEGVPDVLNAEFLANGKLFHSLAMDQRHRFMHYTGPMFQKKVSGGCWQLYKANADGRVMIDLASFAKMNPGYPMGNAKPPVGCGNVGERRMRGRQYFDFGTDLPSLGLSGSDPIAKNEISDEKLTLAPALVYGFSFILKQWGCFALTGFSDISFDSNAFEALVMAPEKKGLVYNLVSQYIAPETGKPGLQGMQRVDPIANKGEGCIFLCYGPPGTGKTLTAESVAETMKRPLWSLSVSELGTNPMELEQTLVKVLDIAATWQAVLLLDEADVYLEKRSSKSDLTRNAMTGVFLRLLEYYRGVLFLTTNRIATFDDAFRSRISMFLRYQKLSVEQKEQIWKTLLGRASIQGATPESITELGSRDLNGREIRNAIHTAQTWAKSKGETTELSHVQYVMGILTESIDALNDAIQHS